MSKENTEGLEWKVVQLKAQVDELRAAILSLVAGENDGAVSTGAESSIPEFIPGGGENNDDYSFRVSSNGDATVAVTAGAIYWLGNRSRTSVTASASVAVSDGQYVYLDIDLSTAGSVTVTKVAGSTVPSDGSTAGHLYVPLAKVTVASGVATVSERYHVGDVILPLHPNTAVHSALYWDGTDKKYGITAPVPAGTADQDILVWNGTDEEWENKAKGTTYHVLQVKSNGTVGYDVVRFPS